MPEPSRSEVWFVDLGGGRGHEQAGPRPGLVVSTDAFNHGPAGLVVLLPLTTKAKGSPYHVEVAPPEGGVTARSYVKCEEPRCVSKDRLSRRIGAVGPQTLSAVEKRLRLLLDL